MDFYQSKIPQKPLERAVLATLWISFLLCKFVSNKLSEKSMASYMERECKSYFHQRVDKSNIYCHDQISIKDVYTELFD